MDVEIVGTISKVETIAVGRSIRELRRQMSKNVSHSEFVICVRNDNYAASLELRKVYRALRDSEASRHQMLRVVDESGEDYLYPEDYFVGVELPRDAAAIFSETS